MGERRVDAYSRIVEKSISPDKVATAFQGAKFLKRLPLALQRKIAAAGTKADPYMGFVVEPYSFFLSYEVDDALARGSLPEGYELTPTSLFEDEAKRKCAILGCFNVHTGVFWGSRFELYVIARNVKTGLVSWIICDYESNTINYDPGNGFQGATLKSCAYTTTFDGRIVADVESAKGGNRFGFSVPIGGCEAAELDKRLWIEGNLSIDYAGALDNGGCDPFGLIFDPGEMASALRVPVERVEMRAMRFGFVDEAMKPFGACCFPFAQHYITTTIPKGHEMRTEADLVAKVEELLEAEASQSRRS